MAVLCTPGREGGHWQAARPGCGRPALAGAGGRTLGGQQAPAVAGVHTPGRGRSYLAVGTPQLQPFSASWGVREDTRQAVRPGGGRSAHAGAGWRTLAGSTPRSWPFCASRGGREDTWQHALAMAGLRTPGRGKSYLAVGTPRPQPFCACRGGREDTRQVACPGCGRSEHAGAGEELPGSGDTPAAVGPCLPGQDGGHQAGSTPRLWPICARWGGREDTGRQHAPAVAVVR